MSTTSMSQPKYAVINFTALYYSDEPSIRINFSKPIKITGFKRSESILFKLDKDVQDKLLHDLENLL